MKETHGGNIHRFERENGGRRPQDHSANLNPLGMPLSGRTVLRDIAAASMPEASEEERRLWTAAVEAYPDPAQSSLTAAIDAFHGGGGSLAARTVCGNGAADIIWRLPGALGIRSALIVCPAFSEYEESLGAAGSRIERYFLSRERGYGFDEGLLEKIAAGEEESGRPYDAVYICQPGNPTGVIFRQDEMRRTADSCRKAGSILVADECFMEFVPEAERASVEPLLRDEDPGEEEKELRLIILKSFTKMFAMASLRLGYCLCSNGSDAEKVRAAGQAWPVSTLAAIVGEAVLGDAAFIQRSSEYIAGERERMKNALSGMGFAVCDGKANYVFFEDPGRADLTSKLRKRGILIRDCSNYAGLGPGCYRAAVKTREENERLLGVLSDY